jgi:hypothetical protein
MAKVNKIDYSKGKIYKIEPLNGDEGDVYIGATSKEYLSQRMTAHRSDYRAWLNKKSKSYTTSFKLFEKYGVVNCSIILLESVNAKSFDELKAREQYYIKNISCVNKVIPLQTEKEYNQKYKAQHKEEIKLYEQTVNREKRNAISKRYYDANKEKIMLQKSLQYKPTECQCGSIVRKIEMTRHNKTKKHIEYCNKVIGEFV